MRWAVLLVGLATGGCHLVFDLEGRASGPDCWNPELVRSDEDGDGIPDGCDNCPAHPNADQMSTDEDAVGDPCDPRLQDGGDRIAFFDGFTAPDARWMVFGTGSWSVVGAARQSLTVQDGTFVLRQDFANATVQTRFSGQTPQGPEDTPSIVGIYVGIIPGQETVMPIPGMLCHSYRKEGSSTLKVEGVPGARPSDSVALEDGTEVHLQLSSSGTCMGRRDSLAPHVVAISLTSDAGEIGLYTHNSEASFDFVTVIESP